MRGFVQMNELLEQSGEDVRLPLDVPALSCTQVILAHTQMSSHAARGRLELVA